MIHRLCMCAVVVLGLAATAFGQTPAPSPLAAFDEATLRRAGIAADAGLLKLLRDHTRTDGDATKTAALIAQLNDDEFERRETATRQLIAAGRPALEALL